MNFRVLRRNRRATSQSIIPKRVITLLIVSIAVFICGATSLAWALCSQINPAEHLAGPPSQSYPANSQEFSYGDITSSSSAEPSSPATNTVEDEQADTTVSNEPGDNTEGIVALATTGAQASAPSLTYVPEPALPPEEESLSTSSSQTSEASSSGSQTPTAPAQSEQQTRTIHHNAYQEVPIYRTVHHQASTAREITIGGVTRIEWTVCPVCAQRHTSAYNERIVDHVNEILCAACGQKHEKDFDEVLYY